MEDSKKKQFAAEMNRKIAEKGGLVVPIKFKPVYKLDEEGNTVGASLTFTFADVSLDVKEGDKNFATLCGRLGCGVELGFDGDLNYLSIYANGGDIYNAIMKELGMEEYIVQPKQKEDDTQD